MDAPTPRQPTEAGSSRARAVRALQIGLALVLALVLWFHLTPWPGSMVIRAVADYQVGTMQQALAEDVPSGIHERRDLQYRPDDKDAFLDVYTPPGAAEAGTALPTIVWVHGGAWVAGNKNLIANYMRILAGEGHTVVAVGYSLAPEAQYPTPIVQVLDSLAYLNENARQLNIDPQHFVLAGDSAGAQIAAQSANVLTNPEYARTLDLPPTLAADQLAGVILAGGAFDLNLMRTGGVFGWLTDTALWAYSGTRDYRSAPTVQSASSLKLTEHYPPTYITVGNSDPLYTQSVAMKARLQQLDVDVQSMIFDREHQPKLEHEYQFELNGPGKLNLRRMDHFITKVTQLPPQSRAATDTPAATQNAPHPSPLTRHEQVQSLPAH